MISTEIKVVTIKPVTPFVIKLVLQTEKSMPFKAGQYLHVIMGENDKRPFSIANVPNDDNLIELHIGANPDNPYAYEVIEKAKADNKLSVEIGVGDAFLRESDMPAVLIAGGTGYTYTKSILTEALANQPSRHITLYWGAKVIDDLYDYAELTELTNTFEHFVFIPVLENPPADWQGKVGLVHKAVIVDFPNMTDIQVYVAGRFDMAAVIKKEFLPLGLAENNLFGDAFAFL